jgi:hypothetical protein
MKELFVTDCVIHRRGQNHPNINTWCWYAKPNSGSGRSAESATFISEFTILHKNPPQPVTFRTVGASGG